MLVCVGALTSGCTWQGYAIGRAVRTVTGAPTRVHTVVPVTSLRRYRVIETHDLDNRLGRRIPAEDEKFLNDVLAKDLRLVESSPRVVREDQAAPGEPAPEGSSATVPTLVLDGSIEDYDPGYFGLRLVELGFNHMVATVRIRLRDKQTGKVVGAASITAQDDRLIATPHALIGRLVDHVRSFVSAGYAR
jgi:hypothetical protein